MNISANILGLDNAATPLGLKAMRELQEINPQPDTASNPMIMFLVLNTAGITLIPTSVIAIRQSLALKQGLVGFNAADIFLPTLLATFISFCAGLVAVALWQRLNLFCRPVLAFFAAFAALLGGLYAWLGGLPPEQMAQAIGLLGSGIIVAIIVLFVAVAAWQGIDAYESFVDGAKEGFGVAVQIIPYLIAMLAAISVFRTTGCMDYLIGGIRSLVLALGLNADFVPALPVGLMKTLSGSGARGLMVDVMTTYGVDSFLGKLAAIIQGSTETTFYVLAVYFGSVGITKTRYALACGLIADAVGWWGRFLLGMRSITELLKETQHAKQPLVGLLQRLLRAESCPSGLFDYSSRKKGVAMFNLLVTADEEAWCGQPTTFPLSRCLREYTDSVVTERFGSLDNDSAVALTRIPAIFAYEEAVGKSPKFGRITNISKRPNRMEVRVDYELIELPKFLTNEELWAMGAELDLGSWESSRTHWAVKDVDLVRELIPKGILLPGQFVSQPHPPTAPARVDITTHRFDVAFSFPGEYRDLVESVAKETTALLGAHACFYDMNYQAQLARPALDLLLQDIYGKRSKLLVVFIGTDYQRKMWPGIEWTAIRSVMTTAKANGRIMYVRMDEGTVEGVFPHDGYIDARRFSPAQIAAFIAERIEFAPALTTA